MIMCPVPTDRVKQFIPIIQHMVDRVDKRIAGSSKGLDEKLVTGRERLIVFIEDKRVISFITYGEMESGGAIVHLGASDERYEVDYVQCVQDATEYLETMYDSITLQGRKGWERALAKLGYKYYMTVLRREI